ncbi:hypothetical protein KQJ29_36640, partial [Enterococcus sp. S181_ASV_20]|nr:hypothetical protein [Enterococcus sp. S181_ASV_20]
QLRRQRQMCIRDSPSIILLKGSDEMDGSKFDQEPVNEEELLSQGYRKYHGDGIDIYYNKDCLLYTSDAAD